MLPATPKIGNSRRPHTQQLSHHEHCHHTLSHQRPSALTSLDSLVSINLLLQPEPLSRTDTAVLHCTSQYTTKTASKADGKPPLPPRSLSQSRCYCHATDFAWSTRFVTAAEVWALCSTEWNCVCTIETWITRGGSLQRRRLHQDHRVKAALHRCGKPGRVGSLCVSFHSANDACLTQGVPDSFILRYGVLTDHLCRFSLDLKVYHNGCAAFKSFLTPWRLQ